MISWTIPAIFSFLFFAFGTTIERFYMGRKVLRPELSVFFVGLLSLFYIIFIPFVDFYVIDPYLFLKTLLVSSFQVGGLFLLYYSLTKFDASSFVPAITAFMPIFSFGAGIFLSNSSVSIAGIVAFLFLLSGSFIVSYHKKIEITKETLFSAFLTSILLSMFFVFSKFVFEESNFWTGFIWINIADFVISSLIIVFYKEARDNLLEIIRKAREAKAKREYYKIKYPLAYGFSKISGGIGSILQLFAVSIAPLQYMGIIQAFQGLEIFFVILFSLLFFKIWKDFPTDIAEDKNLVKRVSGAVLISIGLVIVHLYL